MALLSWRRSMFGVVQLMSPPDHHFLDDMEQGAGGGKEWSKRVQKEWKILRDNLPDTIYVRAFEDRMDLLRAAMVGAAGTPYQDGLFFFDVRLPPASYPRSRRSVNPNLDNSGTVLVLTAQPYYNEARYEETLGTPGGARDVLPYAENAYVLALRTMLHLLRRPPAGFEALVWGHFRRRGRFVLRACEAYLMQGCPVGTLDADACATAESGDRRPCSAGLRLALAGVVPRLIEAFTEIGADGFEEFDRLRLQLGGGGVPR
ncbi:hypothetical protein SETIT_7G266000v2 [Setaria italica]|uniref:UBC core domain-containing protein n=1 Tax=Setaria italica TaxID=4555 RepID=A0A368S1Q0_SETIT|nr:hypothetical protein SETIT_7G266000v2 [Setaria italica]